MLGRLVLPAGFGAILVIGASAAVWALGCDKILGDTLTVGDCNAGEVRCTNNDLEACDAGVWWTKEECEDQTCDVDGGCFGDCAPDAGRCAGERVQTCLNGYWPNGNADAGAECAAGLRCSAGECVLICSSGDLRCSGNTPQECFADGGWSDLVPGGCGACEGCNAAAGTCQGVTVTCVESPSPCASPGAMCDDTEGCAAKDGTACDDGDACSASSACYAGVCNPSGDHVWAHWDLTVSPSQARYTWTPFVVFDSLTGRTWQRHHTPAVYDAPGALAYCANLSMPGYPSGWRLPSRIELVSIIDYTRALPAIDPDAFPSALTGKDDFYWSSSPYLATAGYAWLVFSDGRVNGDGVNTGHVRCVR